MLRKIADGRMAPARGEVRDALSDTIAKLSAHCTTHSFQHYSYASANYVDYVTSRYPYT